MPMSAAVPMLLEPPVQPEVPAEAPAEEESTDESSEDGDKEPEVVWRNSGDSQDDQ